MAALLTMEWLSTHLETFTATVHGGENDDGSVYNFTP